MPNASDTDFFLRFCWVPFTLVIVLVNWLKDNLVFFLWFDMRSVVSFRFVSFTNRILNSISLDHQCICQIYVFWFHFVVFFFSFPPLSPGCSTSIHNLFLYSHIIACLVFSAWIRIQNAKFIVFSSWNWNALPNTFTNFLIFESIVHVLKVIGKLLVYNLQIHSTNIHFPAFIHRMGIAHKK